MTEEALRQHCIQWGVESAAPQFGTTIPVLKGWLRGDNMLPRDVWQNWLTWSSAPESQRAPIYGMTVPQPLPQENTPALMAQSSLASRVLSDPTIAARIKAETAPAQAQVAAPEILKDQASEFLKDPAFARRLPDPKEIAFEEPIPNGSSRPKLGTIAFCCPTDRDFPPTMFECFSILVRNYQMPLIVKSETLLIRARNIIVERFLRTKCEWSFWVDSDMLVPFGNADWFRDKSKITNLRQEQYAFDAVKRLLSHRRDFVGAVYASRTEGSQMIIQPDLEPRHQADKDLANQIRKNQANGIKEVAWIGFGCCLVHRRVFEAVGKNDPDVRSGKTGVFDTPHSKGEDVRFCERATAAGFRPWLDSELVCGHLGRQCFKPENTRGKE